MKKIVFDCHAQKCICRDMSPEESDRHVFDVARFIAVEEARARYLQEESERMASMSAEQVVMEAANIVLGRAQKRVFDDTGVIIRDEHIERARRLISNGQSCSTSKKENSNNANR